MASAVERAILTIELADTIRQVKRGVQIFYKTPAYIRKGQQVVQQAAIKRKHEIRQHKTNDLSG